MLLLDVNAALAEYAGDTAAQYDLFRFSACLQGIVNREKPSLFLDWQEHDRFWLDYCRGPGKFLEREPVDTVSSFRELLVREADRIRALGLIVWDDGVPSTLNAATTVCGTEGFLPVRRNSRALALIREITGAEVRLDLSDRFDGRGTVWGTDEPSTGSAKCDAYVWALSRAMKDTADDLMFFTLDGGSWAKDRPYYPDLSNAFVPNMDYAVAKKAFVFDLFAFDDEAPSDDPGQKPGTDLAVMKRILRAQYEKNGGEKITTVCGFNPWHIKYTTHNGRGRHEPVEAEWRLTEVFSAYNCVKDADAAGYCGLGNASVWRFYPLKKRYENRRPSPPAGGYDPEKTYVLFYVGDYDSAAWTARFIPRWAADPLLGKNPLMWCFNPNLSDRIPMAFDFAYERFTERDYFAAGDSGAGYNNPRLLYPPRIFSDLPSGAEANVKHNLPYFERFGLSHIGFVINGVHPVDGKQKYDLARFAKGGVAYLGAGDAASVVNGVPFIPHTCDIAVEHTDPKKAAEAAAEWMAAAPPEKKFHVFRTILVSPTNHDRILAELKKRRPDVELLDPFTFFAYLKTAVENGNTY
ncbi:MAG: hypothetical protein II779_01460 [Clostridia bacterium]|nr:hypothetical protein [Clostridia bacterium]